MRHKDQKITQEDIKRALKKFRESGGIIIRLSDECVQSRQSIGAKTGAYEPIFELAWANPD